MPQFSANLWYMFQEWEMMDRFSVSAEAGFQAVEFHFPYQWSANILAEKLAECGLKQVLINAPAGKWESGERGIAALPGRQNEFQDTIGLAVKYALALDCPRLHVMAGLDGDSDVYLENLTYAVEVCAHNEIKVLIEALNPIDVPGYMIANTQDALAVLNVINHNYLLLQYDLYHGAMNAEDLLNTILENLDVIGHMQVAAPPDRHEPDIMSIIDFSTLFQSIDELGYAGWIGCEYSPRAGTLEGLGWAKAYGIG